MTESLSYLYSVRFRIWAVQVQHIVKNIKFLFHLLLQYSCIMLMKTTIKIYCYLNMCIRKKIKFTLINVVTFTHTISILPIKNLCINYKIT